MHCNLRPPEPRQPIPASITTPCQVYYSVFAADTLLYAVTLTFDREHLQRIACDVTKLCTKFERNRAICGGVIAFSVFDLMTLNILLRVLLGSGIIFTKFDLRQLIGAILFFYAAMLRHTCDLYL